MLSQSENQFHVYKEGTTIKRRSEKEYSNSITQRQKILNLGKISKSNLGYQLINFKIIIQIGGSFVWIGRFFSCVLRILVENFFEIHKINIQWSLVSFNDMIKIYVLFTNITILSPFLYHSQKIEKKRERTKLI